MPGQQGERNERVSREGCVKLESRIYNRAGLQASVLVFFFLPAILWEERRRGGDGELLIFFIETREVMTLVTFAWAPRLPSLLQRSS